MIFPATTALGQAFATIVSGICAAVGARLSAAPALAAVLSQVYWRIGRLDRLVQHWHADTLPKPRAPGAAHTRATRTRPAPPAAPRPRIPDGPAMLLHLAQRTAQYRGQIETFLERPDTRALVRAAPQAGRILRPLCRSLAIDLPDYLRPPPRPRRTPKPRPQAPIRIPPNQPLGTPDRPLPTNIRAAARAWKKYDR